MEIKKLPGSQIEFSVIVEADKFILQTAETIKELGNNVKVDGFRPGKAPAALVEKTIGKEKIIAHAAKKSVEKSYHEAVRQNSLEVVGEPSITVTKIAEGNDLEYNVKVAVMPQIDLGNYREIAKQNPKSEEKPVNSSEVQKELEKIRKSRAKYVTVSREAQLGDRVEIDFIASSNGEEIEGGSSKNHPVIIGEGYFIPGFENQLIGMKEKDEKTFKLSFPKEYHAKHLAGKPADFRVNMKLVQERILPKLNDEFAKSLGKFKTLEDLSKSILEGLAEEQRSRTKEEWRTTLLEKLMDESEFDVPDILIENELQKMLSEFSSNIAGTGLALDDYLQKIGKGVDDLKKEWREKAEKRVRAALILAEISKLEQIDVPSEDVEKEMNKILAYYKDMKGVEEKLDIKNLFDYTKSMLKNEKVFEALEKNGLSPGKE